MSAMKHSGIYAIVNTVTGKRYIGSSYNIAQRVRKHQAALRRGEHHSSILQRAWDKYGEAEFTAVVLIQCATEHLELYEQLCLDNLTPEYNCSKSAKSPVKHGEKLSPERIAKITAAVRERYASGWKVKHPPRTQVYNDLMSDIVIDRWKDPQYKARVKASMQSKFATEEIRAIRSDRVTTLWQDPEYRNKAIAARKGKAYNVGYKCTPEQVENRKKAGRISNTKRKFGDDWKQAYAQRYPEHIGDLNG